MRSNYPVHARVGSALGPALAAVLDLIPRLAHAMALMFTWALIALLLLLVSLIVIGGVVWVMVG